MPLWLAYLLLVVPRRGFPWKSHRGRVESEQVVLLSCQADRRVKDHLTAIIPVEMEQGSKQEQAIRVSNVFTYPFGHFLLERYQRELVTVPVHLMQMK